ncbi:hypothetical protein [Dysgonomonas sp. 520]|uniref:hypothetical protein n=1 Tax=Dysgonomonas sp. 520 TaxID=2302931 RepID=UPI0013D1BEDE|nr:hypothetical protein [Dysgonomonas sp. 520]NDW08935.1 hypothetical protein [Dysgonomonas sp. 520]
MKKILLLLISILTVNTASFADSSYLSSFDFEYNLYRDDPVIWGVKEKGIDKDSFLEFMFSEERLLGEKITLISTLSAYFEFAYLDENRDKDEVSYFEDYREEFLQRLFNEYNTVFFTDKKIPAEYRLLYMLMSEFDSTNYYLVPEVSKYVKLIDSELPNSLAAQSIKVLTFAYDIIYTPKKQSNIIAMYKNRFHEPYKENWEKYDVDISPKVGGEVLGWLRFVEED